CTTRPRIQVDLALDAILHPETPIIANITPKQGTLGTSLTVKIDGLNFSPGASASFGADVTVTSTTVVSPIQLSLALSIAPTAARAVRDVTVMNPGGQSATGGAGFRVLPPPATIRLAFLGRLRDKVGPGSAAFTSDGALDGTFRVTVQPGSGAR